MDKRLFLVISITFYIATAINAKNYFKDGTHWIVESSVYYGPDYTSHSITDKYINGYEIIDNTEYLRMYQKNENGNVEFLYFLRSEGEKVYMRNTYSNTDYLIYNFGLKPGESCTIYQSMGLTMENRHPFEWQLTFSDILYDSEWGENKLLLEGFMTFMNKPISLDKEYWIDGIGSIIDPGINLISGIAGYSSHIVEVIVDGESVYKYNDTSVAGIQTENVLNTATIFYRLDGTFDTKPTKGINIVNGRKIMY